MTRINLGYVADRLNARGIRAVVWYTGGGHMTIQAGKTWEDSEGCLRYEVLAGPGRLARSGPTFGDAEAFYVGPDDDGQTPVRPVSEVLPSVSDEAVAELIALQCTGKVGKSARSGRRRWGRRKR